MRSTVLTQDMIYRRKANERANAAINNQQMSLRYGVLVINTSNSIIMSHQAHSVTLGLFLTTRFDWENAKLSDNVIA